MFHEVCTGATFGHSSLAGSGCDTSNRTRRSAQYTHLLLCYQTASFSLPIIALPMLLNSADKTSESNPRMAAQTSSTVHSYLSFRDVTCQQN